MKSLAEALTLFRENVVRATIDAPDKYQDWDTGGYQAHRTLLMNFWSEIRPRIKHDLDKVAYIDDHLAKAIESFDRGEREPGQSLMFKIYNVLNEKRLS
jgi:hypothetical protein